MATAYATIANEGRRVEPTAISRVVRDGDQGEDKVLYEAPDHPEGKQVIEEEIAHKATEIMIGDVTEGIAKDASLGDRPVAGKTGTSENFFDAWFIGYTPQLVTGIWMGYGEGGQTLEYTLDYARKLNGLTGGVTPAEIWRTYMEEALRGEPIEQFEGVEIPKKEEQEQQPTDDETTVPENGATTTGAVPGGATTTDPPLDQPAAMSPRGAASAAPSSVAPSSVVPTDPAPAGAAASSVSASSAAPSSAAPSSVGPASAAPR
jgi:penicillin-binding protein 1A